MRLIINGSKKFPGNDWTKTEIEVSIDDCESITLEIVDSGFSLRISKAVLDWAIKTYIEGCQGVC